MRASTLLIAGLSALAQATRDAPVVDNNPNVIYQAILPKDAFYHGPIHGNIRGSVRASRGPDGKGVKYNVHFENFPKEGGPFSMFIFPHLRKHTSELKYINNSCSLPPSR